MGTKDTPFRRNFRKAYYANLQNCGMPLMQIAEKMGRNHNTFYAWARDGEGLPTIDDVATIAAVAQVSPAWLAYGIGPNKEEADWLTLFRMLNPADREIMLALMQRLGSDSMLEKAAQAFSSPNERKPDAPRRRIGESYQAVVAAADALEANPAAPVEGEGAEHADAPTTPPASHEEEKASDIRGLRERKKKPKP